jgi:hypothetical protein
MGERALNDPVSPDWLSAIGLPYCDYRGGVWRLGANVGLAVSGQTGAVQIVYYGGRGSLLRLNRLVPGRAAVLSLCDALGVTVNDEASRVGGTRTD